MKDLQQYLDEPRILYVGGLGSSKKTSSTYRDLKKSFARIEYFQTTVSPTSQPIEYAKRLQAVAHKYNMIIGSSMGAFFVLAITEGVRKIVINPCLKPSIEIPKLTADITSEAIEQFEKMQNNLPVDNELRASTFGIFGSKDELFNFQAEFKKTYHNMCIVPGTHRLTGAGLFRGLEKADIYFQTLKSKLNEELITEHFINVFVDENEDLVSKWGKQVMDMLEKAYAPIGGLLGCDTLDDLVNDSDLWKLCTKSGRLVAVAIYNFKRGGRKLMYVATSGDEEGKTWLYKILSDDIKFKDRSAWMEVSGKMEHIMAKQGAIPVPAEIAQRVMKDKQFISISDDGYHYTRLIGGEPHEKIMFGYPKA